MSSTEYQNRLNSALLDSADADDLEKVKRFVEMGADVNSARLFSGETVLHLACRKQNSKMVSFLIENGADPYKRNKFGQTPMHCACVGRELNQDVINLLFCAGASLFSKDIFGYTPVTNAVRYGHDMREIIQVRLL